MKEIPQDIKDYAHYYRSLFFKDMEKNVLAFESNLLRNGISVSWAKDVNSLNDHIAQQLPNKPYKKVCLDLGDNTAKDIHKADFNECSISSLVNREYNVDALIIESDFAIANEGVLVFVDRATQSCFNYVDNIVVIVNIDQILLNMQDLPVFLYIKSPENADFPSDIKFIKSNINQVIPDPIISSESKGYNTIKSNVSVILYDKNIEYLLADDLLMNSIFCINCGKCREVCPVAKTTNISPIDIVKNNCLDEYNTTQNIFKQTTLCGLCQEVCPVNIPLTEMLEHEMNIVNMNFSNWKKKNIFNIFSKRQKLNKTTNFFLYRFWIKLLFGKNKNLYNYFLKNKATYFSIQEESDSTDIDSSDNAIL
ncbi:MAG: LUD domain-containing protein [Bacteroidales bacterium]|nr:LUD domain-containing protein [Bacteroidales bacterium]